MKPAAYWEARGLDAMIAALEARDPYTSGHSIRVAAFAVRIAEAHGGICPALVQRAAAVHDIGKIGVPDVLLHKAGEFSPEERAIFALHPVWSEKLLAHVSDDLEVLAIVRHHHERWDGLGYPDGIAGESIPLGARIITVADTLDAMTSDRPYRQALSFDRACAEITGCSESQFDPGVVTAFRRVRRQIQQMQASFSAGDLAA